MGPFCVPLQSPATLAHRLLLVYCCLGVFGSFLDPEEGKAAVFSSQAPPHQLNSGRGRKGMFPWPPTGPGGSHTFPPTG